MFALVTVTSILRTSFTIIRGKVFFTTPMDKSIIYKINANTIRCRINEGSKEFKDLIMLKKFSKYDLFKSGIKNLLSLI